MARKTHSAASLMQTNNMPAVERRAVGSTSGVKGRISRGMNRNIDVTFSRKNSRKFLEETKLLEVISKNAMPTVLVDKLTPKCAARQIVIPR